MYRAKLVSVLELLYEKHRLKDNVSIRILQTLSFLHHQSLQKTESNLLLKGNENPISFDYCFGKDLYFVECYNNYVAKVKHARFLRSIMEHRNRGIIYNK